MIFAFNKETKIALLQLVKIVLNELELTPFRGHLIGKRSMNHTLSVRREIWNAGVHANKVDTCDGQRFRSIEWLGARTPARWTLPL